MSRWDYSKDKEYMRFLKFLDDFFTMESTKWNNLNDLKSDEILTIIDFYEEFLLKLDEIYPESREKSERRYELIDKTKYKYQVKHKYKFHHYLFPFHYILEDRLDFFKNLKIGIDFWNQKKFNRALKHFKIIYDSILEIKKEKTFGHRYRKSKYGQKEGFLPMHITPTRTFPFYARGFCRDDMKNGNFKELINVVKNRIEDLNPFFQYREIIELFNENFKIKSYNRAFDNYLKAEYYRNKIQHSNLGYFGILEKEEKLKEKFAVVLLNLTNKIRRVVLDLGTKFTRLEIKEIKEKCYVESKDLIVNVIKNMIKNHEIYAEYFSSSSAIAFNQQANIEEIDNLMKKYEQWEKEEKRKI